MKRLQGGLGLDHRAQAVVFEGAGYSPLGPVAMNCFAPDEANMHLLEEVAEERQKEEWLRPLAEGRIRSCFMMTEPTPGAGADPSMLQTTARRDGSDFVIDGTKWLITGAVGAAVAIIMAKNDSDALGPAGAPTTSPPITRVAAPPSASRWASTRVSSSCSPTTRWTSTRADS